MNISLSLFKNLIRAVRTSEELNNIIKYSEYGETYLTHMLHNEVFYLRKLSNNEYKKRHLYEEIITNHQIEEFDVFKTAISKLNHMSFNELFVQKVQTGMYNYVIPDISSYKTINLDYLINAGMLFQNTYCNYKMPQAKLLYAEVFSNAFLASNSSNNKFTTLISQAIFSNYDEFVKMITDKNNFIDFYLQLVIAQNKKNLERIKNTEELMNKNKEVLSCYDKKISDYIYKHSMFSISDFVKEVEISYNTGKKYLRELVELEILKSVKVGKHNAFIYQELYHVWNH